MSKKSKIFSYGTGKRKIGHSKFDMGFSNQYSQGFGALNPVALYETLPDDYWNIASDGVTLLKPLAAPAFTDIKQHFYAFNVRNSAIWEHWNDFITNGTAFSDVYGSNATNQSAENPWKIPSINAGYLQDVVKIGTGFAVVVHSVALTDLNPFISDFFDAFEFHNVNTSVRSYYDITDAFALWLTRLSDSNAQRSQNIEIPQPYVQYLIDAFITAVLEVNNGKMQVNLMLAAPTVIFSALCSIFSFTGNSVVSSSEVTDSIGDNMPSSDSSLSSTETHIDFLAFSDDSTTMCKRSLSPFILSPMSYVQNDNVYKTFRYTKRVSVVDADVYYDKDKNYGYFRSADTNFLGRNYGFSYSDGVLYFYSSRYSAEYFDPDTEFYWRLNSTKLSDHYKLDYGRLISWVKFHLDSVVPYFGVVNSKRYQFGSSYGFQGSDTLTYSFRVFAPAFADGEVNTARSLGYDGDGFCVYLSRSSSYLLDALNYPVSALACRSYLYYRYQNFNALPLFANSKIWDKFFRNTVVSSPELDYSKTNGQILFDTQLRNFLSDHSDRPSVMPDEYEGVDISSLPSNGWCIPFEAQPLNSMLSDAGVSVSGSFIVQLSGHHNILTLRSREDVFALLTGFGLQELVLRKMYEVFRRVTADNGLSYYTFSELFTKNFYLPSYYNGLLHLKYQNFNKDYFSAAMLDPMSGANQVDIGTTVTENRLAEAKQSWFERIAPQRSVKGFMEAIFGITPTLDDKEPRFLGSHHVKVNIGEVIQTSSTTESSPQGQRVGIGGSRGDGNLVHGHVNEHGWIIIYNSFTVESQYHQGLEKQLQTVTSYLDYPTIDFANVGNESILMKELNFDGEPRCQYNLYGVHQPMPSFSSTGFVHHGLVSFGSGNPLRVTKSGDISSFPNYSAMNGDLYKFRGIHNIARGSGTSLDNVFGYIPRYSSYKFKLDQVHGEFLDELDFWQTFRNLHGMPILSHEFVNWELCVDDNEFNRIFSVTTNEENKFLCLTRFNSSVDRALPYVCVPHSK